MLGELPKIVGLLGPNEVGAQAAGLLWNLACFYGDHMHQHGAVEQLILLLDTGAAGAAAEEAAGALNAVLTWYMEEEDATGVNAILCAVDGRIPAVFAELTTTLADAAERFGDKAALYKHRLGAVQAILFASKEKIPENIYLQLMDATVGRSS